MYHMSVWKQVLAAPGDEEKPDFYVPMIEV